MSASPRVASKEDLVALRRFVVWCQRFILLAVAFITIGVLISASGDWRRYLNLVMMASIAILSHWQMRTSPRHAMIVIAMGVWLVSSAGILLLGGVHSANVLIYPFTIATVGWALGRRWLVAITLLTLVFLGAVGVAEIVGWFVPTPRADAGIVTIQVIVVLSMIALMSFEGRQILANSRDRAIELGRELEQRALEAAARERQVAQLLDNVPAAVASFDAQSHVRNCNLRYASLFGLTVEDVVGRATADFVPAAQLKTLSPYWRLALAGKPQSYRRLSVHPHTQVETWLECSLVPEWDDDGTTVTGLYAMLVDVTDKVRADAELLSLNNELEARVARRTAELARAMENLHASREELVRSQAKAGLAALVASVSHELSTPIGNSVLVASSLSDMARQLQHQMDTNQLKKSGLLQHNQALAEGCQMLMRNLARAESLLKNFKQVSADQASEQRRAFDLAEVVAEVVSSMAPSLKTLGHRVEQDIPEGIVMDSLPGPMGQVIINLINNAYHHAFEGRNNGLLTISARVHAANVHLQVSDNGAGMAADVLLNLFEPFFSTKIGQGGTGLGMSIVDSIVRKTLGGSIAVRSVVGEGTSYDMVLPLKAPVLYDEA